MHSKRLKKRRNFIRIFIRLCYFYLFLSWRNASLILFSCLSCFLKYLIQLVWFNCANRYIISIYNNISLSQTNFCSKYICLYIYQYKMSLGTLWIIVSKIVREKIDIRTLSKVKEAKSRCVANSFHDHWNTCCIVLGDVWYTYILIIYKKFFFDNLKAMYISKLR